MVLPQESTERIAPAAPAPAPAEPVAEPTPAPTDGAAPAAPEPTFRQALTAGVHRLATTLDDLNVAMGRKEQASTAVDDARQQVASVQSNHQSAGMAVDDARTAAVDAFDILTDTLASGRDAVLNG